jgi:putative FmdB family regulatory protein
MPTYEYRCKKCGHEFEKFQSMTAPAVRKCPSCGKQAVERLISSGAGVIFKGSGFYETDYKRSGKPCEQKSGSDSDSGSASSGDEKPCKSCDKAESCPSSTASEE